MRAIFIAAGITLIHKFHWVMYVLGVFLILTGVKMAVQKDKKIRPRFCGPARCTLRSRCGVGQRAARRASCPGRSKRDAFIGRVVRDRDREIHRLALVNGLRYRGVNVMLMMLAAD